jgi:hypothetical protein
MKLCPHMYVFMLFMQILHSLPAALGQVMNSQALRSLVQVCMSLTASMGQVYSLAVDY